jgi:hypothetical protein
VARAEAVVDDEVKPVLGDEGGLRSETRTRSNRAPNCGGFELKREKGILVRSHVKNDL